MSLEPRTTPRAAAPAAPEARPGFRATIEADDFTALCELVRRLCGVDLLQYKRGQMERRVRTWAQRRGTPELAAYGERLKADADELDAFLDRVTINVSHLWRHEDQWDALARTILPELAKATGRIRAWSAGCSYGAEAYTLAAVCRESVPNAHVEIHGTDLDRRMVERARAGTFTVEDARTAPVRTLERWFEKRAEGGWQAKPELRSMTRFDTGDLLRMPVPRGRYDLVICRNTVIYFTEEVRDALHERLVTSLAPGGYLVVGTSERVADPRGLGLTSPFHFIYKKS
jgi:chemotaxis protein methyltransferase CheR